jgi:hypothetical protein
MKPLTKIVRVRITNDLIKKGRPRSSTTCPIALGLNKKLGPQGGKGIKVDRTQSSFHTGARKTRVEWTCQAKDFPKAASAFIMNLDCPWLGTTFLSHKKLEPKKPVKPQTFRFVFRGARNSWHL